MDIIFNLFSINLNIKKNSIFCLCHHNYEIMELLMMNDRK